MKLKDVETGKEVASIVGDEIRLPDGKRYKVEGYAVVDIDGIIGEPGQVVGTFDDKSFWTDGKLMAVVEGESQ